MDDLIKREDAIRVASGYCHPVNIPKELAKLPSAEPEIIRCKDCKHYKEWESEFTPNAVVTQCMADNFPIRKAIPDGWFCAGAERREE